MEPKEGEVFISKLDTEPFVVQAIVNDVVILRSRDGKRAILTSLTNLELLYQRQDSGTEKGPERRKHPRYLVQHGMTVSLHNEGVRVGDVKDVSMGGLAFEYIELGDGEASNRESLVKKHLYVLSKEFSLFQVSCRMVYDISVQPSSEYKVFSIVSMTRRCGVQFGILSDNQITQVKAILDKANARSNI